MGKIKTRCLFSAFLALMPLIGIYASMIPGLNIAELVLLFFWIIFLIQQKFVLVFKGDKFLYLFTLYITVTFIVNSLFNGIDYDILFRLVRFSFYYLTVAIWGSVYFQYYCFEKYLKLISYISVAFIVFQYVMFFVFGKSILGFIPFLTVYHDYNSDRIIESFSYYFRPASIFTEPAQLCQYLFIFLVISLFFYKDCNYISAAICTLGILLSTSGQGVMIGVIIWSIWLYRMLLTNKLSLKKIIQRLFLSIISLFTISNLLELSLVKSTLARLTQEGEQSARFARLDVYNYFLDNNDLLDDLIGHSYGSVISEKIFMPDIAYIIYGSGFIGLVIILLYLLQSYKKYSFVGSRLLILVLFLLFFGASVFRSLTGIVYLILISNPIIGNSIRQSKDL